MVIQFSYEVGSLILAGLALIGALFYYFGKIIESRLGTTEYRTDFKIVGALFAALACVLPAILLSSLYNKLPNDQMGVLAFQLIIVCLGPWWMPAIQKRQPSWAFGLISGVVLIAFPLFVLFASIRNGFNLLTTTCILVLLLAGFSLLAIYFGDSLKNEGFSQKKHERKE
jgi:hypothetical protein